MSRCWQPNGHARSSLTDFFLLPWRWRRYVPPKRQLTQYLHGVTSQMTAFFIVTAVKTSNLTFYHTLYRTHEQEFALSTFRFWSEMCMNKHKVSKPLLSTQYWLSNNYAGVCSTYEAHYLCLCCPLSQVFISLLWLRAELYLDAMSCQCRKDLSNIFNVRTVHIRLLTLRGVVTFEDRR
jgi:hypothetical protein